MSYSYRFSDLFPDVEHIRDMQKELDEIIQDGVFNITRLLRAAETSVSSNISDDDEFDFEMRSKTGVPTSGLDSDVPAAPVKHRPKTSIGSRFQSAKNQEFTDFGPIKLKPGQRLTDQLVKKGLLTKDMVLRIQKELSFGGSDDDEDDTANKIK